MKSLVVSAALVAAASMAVAGPACNNAPQEKWMPEAGFKRGLEEQGDRFKTFKVSKGQCDEIYGFDKTGKKVEIHFDPVTGGVSESK